MLFKKAVYSGVYLIAFLYLTLFSLFFANGFFAASQGTTEFFFFKTYYLYAVIGSIGIALIGTFTGVLPGTRDYPEDDGKEVGDIFELLLFRKFALIFYFLFFIPFVWEDQMIFGMIVMGSFSFYTGMKALIKRKFSGLQLLGWVRSRTPWGASTYHSKEYSGSDVLIFGIFRIVLSLPYVAYGCIAFFKSLTQIL